MKAQNRVYVAIDLKSFYASVECAARHLDPMKTNLVVADASRTEKTICLAVSPPLKAYGISGRARLFEVVQRVREINAERQRLAPNHVLKGTSYYAEELKEDPSLAVDYITAPPRMSCYIECSLAVYRVYLKYIAPEDIHVYSIDEVFIDVTEYLGTYGMSARELTRTIIQDILTSTGITATAGIGTNLYLCKIAMDIVAKHTEPDKYGVRIAEIDEMSYRRLLWNHRPLTDFWRVGRGYSKKLEEHGMYTMGDIARCSIGKENEYHNEDLLYRLFGVNAELLIDHAWGWEPCTIADIKAYSPKSSSVGSGQVLHCPYDFEKAKLVVREMAEALSMELVEKGLKTDQIVLTVGYDKESLKNPDIRKRYSDKLKTDFYGRKIPRHSHGTVKLGRYTSSTRLISEAAMELYDKTVDKALLIRRLNIEAIRIIDEETDEYSQSVKQLDLFTDYEAEKRRAAAENDALERERRAQLAVLSIKKRFGKNAVIKGCDLEEGATAIERNKQIGGHRA